MLEASDRPDFQRFPLRPGKTYGLMCVVDRQTPAVDAEPEREVQAWPAAVLRELVLFLATLAVLSVLAILFDAPLEEPANPMHPPNPAKAPWYFLGLQELVSYDAFWGGVGIPGLLAALAVLAPYLETRKGGEGVWFHPSRTVPNAVFLAIAGSLGFLTIVGSLFRGENWKFVLPW